MRQVNSRSAAKKPRAKREGGRALVRSGDRSSGWVLGKKPKKKMGRLPKLPSMSLPVPAVLKRPMLLVTFSLVLVGAAAGLVYGGYFDENFSGTKGSLARVMAGAGFAVSEISLAGAERTSPEDVARLIGVKPGDSIFGFDPSVARDRLLQLTWVKDAVVKRHFPDSISVTLIEKRPFALWKSADGSIAVVERDGAIITREGANLFDKLPFLIGEGAPGTAAALIDAIGQQRAVASRLKAVERVSDRRWNLILSGPVEVKLPEEGWEAQIGELERLIVDKGILERDIEMIDLRYPDSYIFRLHNGDSHPVTRERPA